MGCLVYCGFDSNFDMKISTLRPPVIFMNIIKTVAFSLVNFICIVLSSSKNILSDGASIPNTAVTQIPEIQIETLGPSQPRNVFQSGFVLCSDHLCMIAKQSDLKTILAFASTSKYIFHYLGQVLTTSSLILGGIPTNNISTGFPTDSIQIKIFSLAPILLENQINLTLPFDEKFFHNLLNAPHLPETLSKCIELADIEINFHIDRFLLTGLVIDLARFNESHCEMLSQLLQKSNYPLDLKLFFPLSFIGNDYLLQWIRENEVKIRSLHVNVTCSSPIRQFLHSILSFSRVTLNHCLTLGVHPLSRSDFPNLHIPTPTPQKGLFRGRRDKIVSRKKKENFLTIN